MIEVISTGIFTTIQDQGRFGYRACGVPVSGAMDLSSYHLANALLNNSKGCAVMECTLIGPILKFSEETFICVTGAKCKVIINEKLVKNNAVIKINKSDKLSIGKATEGLRSYLGIAGGFQAVKVLNSRSYYSNITRSNKIQKGDRIAISHNYKKILNRSSVKVNNSPAHKFIEVSKGPEFESLSQSMQQYLMQQQFKISSHSNRMAYKLEGVSQLAAKEIISSAVQPGTVQLTPEGELIVLMRDAQTTGGYARVLQLSQKAINYLAQKAAAEFITFQLLHQ